MMTNKFTPGPWHYRTSDGSIGSIDAENGIMVAQAQQTKPAMSKVDLGERIANARLIASAPELLEALNACLSWMESTRECGDCGNWEWDEGSVYKTGLAVLAKAAGVQA